MIQSMTGFGANEGTHEFDSGKIFSWRWETKTVNGRGLDIRFRLPTGYERLETTLRKLCKGLLRGSVSISLTTEITGGGGALEVDEVVLEAALKAADIIQKRRPDVSLSADALLSVRGVLSTADLSLTMEENEIADSLMIEEFAQAIALLKEARESEGATLHTALSTLLGDITHLTDEARKGAADMLRAHREQLSNQLNDLIQDKTFDDQRLEQEIALLATKSDIREELDRLDGHVHAARALLEKAEAVGRSLDFIAQELMREANTLTVKSPTLPAKSIGLALKRSVDQFKEQVQNVA